ncbi:MAG TPA: hypothetical protein VGR73_12730 [Bryobacteraceae bacterium]|nr:hypothetical protein [Bryobacteraceae bacterium]
MHEKFASFRHIHYAVIPSEVEGRAAKVLATREQKADLSLVFGMTMREDRITRGIDYAANFRLTTLEHFRSYRGPLWGMASALPPGFCPAIRQQQRASRAEARLQPGRANPQERSTLSMKML